MKIYNRKEPLISLHVPKTAGTSLRGALANWFPGRLRPHYVRPATGTLPAKHSFEGRICIHGHFNASRGFGVDAYYPQAEQFIVFCRDPFERFLSIWFYGRKVRRSQEPNALLEDDERSFESWIHHQADEHAAGRGIGDVWFFPGSPDLEAIKAAMAERFVFVGLTERYTDSLKGLAKALGQRKIPETHENQTDREGLDFERWRSFHEKKFADDHELYATARKLNAECLSMLR